MLHDNCTVQEKIRLPIKLCTVGDDFGLRHFKCWNNVHFKLVVTVGVINRLAGVGRHGKGAFELKDSTSGEVLIVHVRYDTRVLDDHRIPPKRFRAYDCPVYVGDKIEFTGMVFKSRAAPLGFAKNLSRLRDDEFFDAVELQNKNLPVQIESVDKRNRDDLTDASSETVRFQAKKTRTDEVAGIDRTSTASDREKSTPSCSNRRTNSSVKRKCEDLIYDNVQTKKSSVTERLNTEEFMSIVPVTDANAENINNIPVASVSSYLKFVVDLEQNARIPMRVFGRLSHDDCIDSTFDFILKDTFNELEVRVKCMKKLPLDSQKPERYLLLDGEMGRPCNFFCNRIMEFTDFCAYDEYRNSFGRDMRATVFRRRVQLSVLEALNAVCLSQFTYEVGGIQCKVIEIHATLVAVNNYCVYLSDQTGIIKVKGDQFANMPIGTSVKALGGIAIADNHPGVAMKMFKVKLIDRINTQNENSKCGFVYCLKLAVKDALTAVCKKSSMEVPCRIEFHLVEIVGVVLDHSIYRTTGQKITVGDITGIIEVFVSDLLTDVEKGTLVLVVGKIKRLYDCVRLYDAKVSILSMPSFKNHLDLLIQTYDKVYLPRLGYDPSKLATPDPISNVNYDRRKDIRDCHLNVVRSSDVFRIAKDQDRYGPITAYKKYERIHCKESLYKPFTFSDDIFVKFKDTSF